ncbi:MAG: hypothetical protein RI907_194 [Pseudomonadota bacterium]|jgi:uncharacterized protein involved in cysteine biosynthesis
MAITMDTFAILPLALRDTFRSGLITFVLLGVVGLALGWLALFSVFDAMHWWTIKPDLWGHVKPGSWPSRMAAVAIWVLTYVLTVLVSLALFMSFVVMPRVRSVCLVQYRMLVPVAEGSFIAPLRHAWQQVRQMGGVALLILCVPMLGVLIAPFLAAYFNARSLVLDALESLATDEEVRAVMVRNRLPLFGLGVFTLVWALIPLLGLTAPLLMSVGVCHVSMRGLARLRGYTV